VNDAYGAAHRAHASTAGFTKFVAKSAMGLLMEKELKHLRNGLEKRAKPLVVILGGAKVSDKIGVLKALMENADTILLGGAMASGRYRRCHNCALRGGNCQGRDDLVERACWHF